MFAKLDYAGQKEYLLDRAYAHMTAKTMPLITVGSLCYTAWEESTRYADILRAQAARSHEAA